MHLEAGERRLRRRERRVVLLVVGGRRRMRGRRVCRLWLVFDVSFHLGRGCYVGIRR